MTAGGTGLSGVLWRRQSDADILDAAGRIDDYTDVGQAIIVEEMRRRGLPVPEHLASITSPLPITSPAVGDKASDEIEAGITFFQVTTQKFVVMSVFSFGLYSFYWFFQNWRSLARERARLSGAKPDLFFSPLLRSIFAPLWALAFVREVRRVAEQTGVQVRWAPWVIAAGYMLGNILYRLPELFKWPDQTSALGLMSLAFLVPVQQTITRVTEKRGQNPRANATYSPANLACIVAGGLILLGLIGSLFLKQPTI